MLCVFLGCCDYTNNGPSYVNAAHQHDGSPDAADESPFIGHNRNGEWKSPALFNQTDLFDQLQHPLISPALSANWYSTVDQHTFQALVWINEFHMYVQFKGMFIHRG